jgi:hypothetical protein
LHQKSRAERVLTCAAPGAPRQGKNAPVVVAALAVDGKQGP